MGVSTISLGLGLGGGKAATSSGTSGGGGAFENVTSVSFDGSDDYMDCGTVAVVNNASSITWSGWFKFSASNTLFLTGGINSSNRFSFYLKSGGSLGVYLGSAEQLTSASNLSTDTWYHIAVTKAGNSGTNLVLYINGTANDTGSFAQAMPSSSGVDFRIGNSAVFPGYEMEGFTDEVAIFNSALSASDISTLRGGASAGTLGEPADISSLNPVGWWRMGDNDGGTGTTVTDQGSGGNDGTLTNGPTYSTDVPS